MAGWEAGNDSGSNVSKRKSDSTAGRNDIREAINQLVKFQEFDVNESITSPGRIKGATSPYFPVELSFLAIVFDGKLFEAILDNGKISLEERNHLVLHFIYRPKKSYSNLNFFIDIVHKDYFKEYMAKISADVSLISSKVENDKNKLLTYLKKDSNEPAFVLL